MPSILLTVFLILLVVVCILFSALYFVPLEVSCNFGFRKMIIVRVEVQWGIISFFFVRELENTAGVQLSGTTIVQRTLEEEVPTIPGEEKARVSDWIENIRQLKPLLPYFKDMITVVMRSFTLHSIHCHIRYGCENPAVTGEIFGYLWAIKGALSPCEGFALDMEPDFEKPVIEGETSIQFALEKPLLILLSGLSLVRPLWALQKTWRKS